MERVDERVIDMVRKAKKPLQIVGFLSVSSLLACGIIDSPAYIPQGVLTAEGSCSEPHLDFPPYGSKRHIDLRVSFQDARKIRPGVKVSITDLNRHVSRVVLRARYNPQEPRDGFEETFHGGFPTRYSTDDIGELGSGVAYKATAYEESLDKPDVLNNKIAESYFRIDCPNEFFVAK
jgi:hypothetical protein